MQSNKSGLGNKVINSLKKIVGDKYALLDFEDRYCYAKDAMADSPSGHIPDVVLLPENKEQISKILKIANENNIAVTTRAAGTNLVGGCVPLEGGIVIHTSRMNKIIDINKNNLTCRVEAGVVVEHLQQTVEKEGLFYPPDPASLKVSTIGGSIAQSAGGPRGFKYGTTKDYVLGLTVVLADGSILEMGGSTTKNVTGYNLTQLMVGSEGTLGVIIEAVLKLIPKPETRQVMLVAFSSTEEAANAVTGIISAKITPSVLDFVDKTTMETIEKFNPARLPIESEAALIIELDGFKEAVKVQTEQISEIAKLYNSSEIRVAENQQQADEIWLARRSAYGAVAKVAPDVISGDIVVPRDKFPEMIAFIKETAKRIDTNIYILAHAGDGNIHPHYSVDLRDKQQAEKCKKAVQEVFLKAVELGGTLSGEHGIGISKKKFMSNAMDSKNIDFMKSIKQIFDPKGIINPGKVF